ncbi:hypothetical protein [Celeribacter indicus]|uniref:Uncharacterized protein n=1 Tax=Celeribacter indicus TaxID=1208324 RepID=A0A0B5E3G5_9RHOB|nr:hypothetical protein [Celeribacter indicus]AJE46967.1 hypothetical protein P73_2252 [Celeribacter indicus]SDW77380.1 hypothetical protein SAMN05443573_1078 [Celeribacter indicus]
MSDPKPGKPAAARAPAQAMPKDGMRLFMMLFEARAGAKTRLRPGALHAIAVFMVAPGREIAIANALKGLGMTGWEDPELKHQMDITGRKRLKDADLDRTARTALAKGAGFLVYRNEITRQA